ncbi:MAG TPA: NHL repeat-containing protein [Solirubrobacteraceae bacterium]|nr:NHL repeat-containing protein [Solirubrobacteraceae bacterium]
MGSLINPQYVVAGGGRVYVADPQADRITEYTTNGSPLASWGGHGALPGEFESVWSIALAPNGDVYVASTYNEIEVFDQNGNYLESIMLSSPTAPPGTWFAAMAFGPNGDLYIVDGQAKRIIQADAHGALIRTFGVGKLGRPTAIAVASDGDVYVADGDWHQIAQFSSNGSWLGSFGSTGLAPLYNPNGLTFLEDGSLLVSDEATQLMSDWTSSGELVATYTPASGIGEFRPEGSAAVPGGFLVADMATESVLDFTTASGFSNVWASHVDSDLATANDIAVDAAHGWGYVVDRAFDRLDRVDLASGAISPSGVSQAASPAAVAVGPGGKVAVVDATNNHLDLYESGGADYKGAIQLDGEVWYLAGVAWGSGGDLYVLDGSHGTVTEVTPGGGYVRRFGGGPGDGVGELAYPSAIAAAPDGSLWVLDAGNARLAHFSSSGEWLGSFALEHTRGFANGVAVAPDGRLAVISSDNVVVYASDGTLLVEWGEEGTGIGEFYGAQSGAWDGEGTLWTAEWGAGRLQRFALAPPGESGTTTATSIPTSPTTSTSASTTTAAGDSAAAASSAASAAGSNSFITVTLTTRAPSPPSGAGDAGKRTSITASKLEDAFHAGAHGTLRVSRFRLSVAPGTAVTLNCARHNCRKARIYYPRGGEIDLAAALPQQLKLGDRVTIRLQAAHRRASSFVLQVVSRRHRLTALVQSRTL